MWNRRIFQISFDWLKLFFFEVCEQSYALYFNMQNSLKAFVWEGTTLRAVAETVRTLTLSSRLIPILIVDAQTRHRTLLLEHSSQQWKIFCFCKDFGLFCLNEIFWSSFQKRLVYPFENCFKCFSSNEKMTCVLVFWLMLGFHRFGSLSPICT